jgi:hypothetical protein
MAKPDLQEMLTLQTSQPVPLAPYGAAIMTIISSGLLWNAVVCARSGVFRHDVTRERQPILFWISVGMHFVVSPPVSEWLPPR